MAGTTKMMVTKTTRARAKKFMETDKATTRTRISKDTIVTGFRTNYKLTPTKSKSDDNWVESVENNYFFGTSMFSKFTRWEKPVSVETFNSISYITGEGDFSFKFDKYNMKI